jgi:hypothetical protein
MFIANDVPKYISQPHRGGTGLPRAFHAAPMGLGMMMVRGGCYQHDAPTELARTRLAWSDQSSYPEQPNSPLDLIVQILAALDILVRAPSRQTYAK